MSWVIGSLTNLPELHARLRVICGAANVVTDPHALAVYAEPQRVGPSGSGRGRPAASLTSARPPLAAVLPATSAEVAATVAACAQAMVPWVPRGAGTLAPALAAQRPGGAAGREAARNPEASPVVIALTRMRRVLTADPGSGSVSAEGGTPGTLLHRALAGGPGARVPLEPPSAAESVATLGGLIAAPAPHGPALFGHAVRALALTLVLGDGTLVEIAAGGPGYDLIALFTGSRGAAGIAVSATLQLGAPV